MKKYNEINLEEIKKLNGEVLDDDIFNELMQNENVVDAECLGDSGYCHSYYWYSVKLSDETEIDIYC